MTKEIEQNKKVDILISALNERYQSIHKIRERVQSMGIWFLGLVMAASGWLLQNNIALSCFHKIIYIFAVFIAFIAIRFFYLNDLSIGFKGQQRVQVKLEKSLGFFTPEFFNDSKDSIYPEKWEKAGSGDSDGEFFYTTYILIYIGTAFLALAILIS